MSEQNPEPTHQDPAEPNQVETEVETDNQPEPSNERLGGDVSAPEPVEPPAVPVEPTSQNSLVEPGPKTDNVHGQDYTVTPEDGYRRA